MYYFYKFKIIKKPFKNNKTSHLQKLYLYYGYHTYSSLSKITKYVFHRGMIITWIQQLFTMIYFFMNVSIFNGNLMLGYSSVFTFLPVICIMIHEEMPYKNMISYPNNYLDARKSFNMIYILCWVFMSFYQAFVIVFFSIW